MFRVFDVLVFEHELRLVLLAAAVCVFGAIATMIVSSRAAGTNRVALWRVLLSVCAGATVWSTHFIAMLAYRSDASMTYDPWLTLLSFVSGAALMGLGFDVAIRWRRVRRLRLLGGSIVGVGVVVLHYVGMAAVRMAEHVGYAPDLVITSVGLSLGLGAVALSVALGERAQARTLGALLMVAMIVSLHFTAMGAVRMDHGAGLVDAMSGISRPVLAVAVALASLSVLLIGLWGALVDQRISHQVAAEAHRFRALADGAFEGLIVHHDGVIVEANAAARRMFGLGEAMPTMGALLDGALTELVDVCGEDEPARGIEVTLRRPDGTRFPAEMCRRRILLRDGGEGELLAIRDLTSRKESEARIAHLALHDPLTELPNRRFFMELAAKSISLAHRSRERFALLAMDLDGFKLVNDMHGHMAGDELIRVVARRIAASLREADVAARFGGDEFAVLQTCASQPGQAMSLAERLLEALHAPIRLQDAEVTISVSIGVALYPDDGTTAEDLLRNADTAMYRAKADGKATCRFFEPQMDAAIMARRRLEQGLRRAVAEERLALVYQPIVESAGREPLGFEALLRWEHEELGSIPPSEFIPVAEDTGLIVPIGDFVLRHACLAAAGWPAPLRVAVNLSAVQFRRKGLVQSVRRALEESGLAGDRLELEVTETLLIENRDEALRVLRELKQLGVRIAMDDFGTGYSSLSYLQCFPFDKIKIDRIFVADLSTNEQNASIVQAITAMGRSLGMRVVAEGVETAHQADLLQGLSCDEMQGYLIARPMPAAAIDGFLASHESGPALMQVTAQR